MSYLELLIATRNHASSYAGLLDHVRSSERESFTQYLAVVRRYPIWARLHRDRRVDYASRDDYHRERVVAISVAWARHESRCAVIWQLDAAQTLVDMSNGTSGHPVSNSHLRDAPHVSGNHGLCTWKFAHLYVFDKDLGCA